MGNEKSWRRGVVMPRIALAFFALTLALSIGYAAPVQAYADDLIAGQGATLVAQADTQYLYGGETEPVVSGEYTLFPGDPGDSSKKPATGTITIAENAVVTLNGAGSTVTFSDLNIVVSDGATVTIKDLYAVASSADSKPVLDFQGTGTLKIAGTNMLEQSNAGYYAVIRVAPEASVTFDGDGVLYGYKSAMGAFIGSNGYDSQNNDPAYPNEKSGAMTFKGGTWFLKGSKTGPIIGSDGTSAKPGDITIDGGSLYLWGKAQGACIGASPQGWAPDVVVNGGQLELYLDFNGSAIGYGGDKKVSIGGGKGVGSSNKATLTVNGGSIKPVVGSNGFSSWFTTDEVTALGSAGSTVTDKAVTSDHDTALLTFDASKYASQDSVSVYVDNATEPFYNGPLYGWVANEAGPKSTQANWLANNQKWATDTQKSTFAPDNNLYLYLSKSSHTLKVGSDTYNVVWDAANETFVTSADTSWYGDSENSFEISTLSQMLGFAELVNTGTTFKDKTVTLGADFDLSGVSDWTPIGTADHAFAGTFDGDGKEILGLTIVSATGGYRGLFGNNSGTIQNVMIEGTIGTQEAPIKTGADNIGGIVGYNNGEVSGVTGNVSVLVNNNDKSIYAVGGVVGQNGPNGKVASCLNYADIEGSKAVGGVVGRSFGVVEGCANFGSVIGNQGGKDSIGGVVGQGGDKNKTYTNSISRCYNMGDISNSNGKWVGGIAGFVDGATTVNNCYATGSVSGSGQYNPIIGQSEGKVTSCYCLDSTVATDEDGVYNLGGTKENCAAKTSEYMKSGQFVVDLNTENTLSGQSLSAQADTTAGAFNYDSDGINNGYPVLAWQGGMAITADDVSAVNAVEQAITAIGTVTVNSKAAIDAAQAKLDGLTDTQKALVSDDAKQALTDAKTAYDKAVADKAAADKAAADKAAAEKAAAEKAAAEKAAAEKAAQEAAAKKATEEAAAAAAAAKAVTNGKVVTAGSGASAGTYKVLNANAKTVSYKAPKNKNAKSVTVPATVKLSDGKTYKVTTVEAGAFKNMKKLTKVTIGKNVKTVKAKAFNNLPKLASVTVGAGVTKIASKAFQKTPKLKTITVKSTKLTKKSSVKGALSGSKVKQTVTVKVPKAKKKAYGKVFTKSNLKSPKKVTVK